jgi:tetratricopeptide (TPR) repeat protein
MKSEAIAFAVAGTAFGLVAGWVIGTQQAGLNPAGPRTASAVATPASTPTPAPTAALLDQSKVTAFQSVAEREPSNPAPRAQLANLYFDAERYDEAIKWYVEALKLAPNDVDVSTDLGVCYYYTNQPDKALEQFAVSLKNNPKHVKTLLNIGVVRAFGKQDLTGAEEVWQQVLQLAPESPEGQAAKRALDSLRSAHPGGAAAAKPGV